MQITEDESKLIELLGFDREVVAGLLELAIARISVFDDSFRPPAARNLQRDGEFYCRATKRSYYTDEAKQKQLAILRKIEAQSPDAGDLLTRWIANVNRAPDANEVKFFADRMELDRRQREFAEKAKPYEPYFKEEWARIRKEAQGGRFSAPGFLINRDELFNVEERLEEVRKYFAGKSTPKMAESESEQKAKQKNTKKKPSALVIRVFYDDWQFNMDAVKRGLLDQGYKLEELARDQLGVRFPTEREVLNHFASLGFFTNLPQFRAEPSTAPIRFGSTRVITEMPARDFNLGSEANAWGHWDGDEVFRQVGPDQYQKCTQRHFSARLDVAYLLLRKYKKRAKKDKLMLLKMANTCAPNYGLGPDDILGQIKLWDEKYDVEIEGANSDSVTIIFRNLPDDIRVLCMEALMFCADLDVLHPGPYEENLKRVREFAFNLRQTGKISLWWD